MTPNYAIDDYLKLLGARWKNPQARRRLVVTNHGHGHASVDFEKTLPKINQTLQTPRGWWARLQVKLK